MNFPRLLLQVCWSEYIKPFPFFPLNHLEGLQVVVWKEKISRQLEWLESQYQCQRSEENEQIRPSQRKATIAYITTPFNWSIQEKKNKTKKSQDGCHMKPLNTKAFLVLCQQWMLVVCVFPPLLKTKDYIISKV